MQAKNDAIRAENLVLRMCFEGEQAKVQAGAQTSVRIAQANAKADATVAQRQSAILRAEGETQARIIQQVGKAVAENPTVIFYEASHRWNGQLPGTMLGGTTSPLSMFNIQPGQRAGADTPASPERW